MLLRKSRIATLDTLCFLPYFPENINKVRMNAGLTMNHMKLNDEGTYESLDGLESYPITSYKEDGTSKTPQEIYNMLAGWDTTTLLNAYFSKDLEAGSISGGGEEIIELVIKRLGPESDYTAYKTIGSLPFVKDTVLYFRDYLIESGQVYLYSIQPRTLVSTGQVQSKVAGLNTYEFAWVLDTKGNQLRILNSAIPNMLYNTKDATVETIGSEYPFVNRYSSLDYRSFNLTGTIATELDADKDFELKATSALYGHLPRENSNYALIQAKYLEKYGVDPTTKSNAMSVDTAHERLFRDYVLAMLRDGERKIFKSETEGLMLVKFSAVNITPKTVLGRVLYDFSMTVTEIGKVTPELINEFIGINKVPNFTVPERLEGENNTDYERRYDLAEFGY